MTPSELAVCCLLFMVPVAFYARGLWDLTADIHYRWLSGSQRP